MLADSRPPPAFAPVVTKIMFPALSRPFLPNLLSTDIKSTHYPRPVLILGGELDGQLRWPWQAALAADAAVLAQKAGPW